MTTLFAVYDSDSCAGRCDASCYDAGEPGCSCICGGVNHGAGKQQAIARTRAHALQWLDRATEANPSIVAADILPGSGTAAVGQMPGRIQAALDRKETGQ